MFVEELCRNRFASIDNRFYDSLPKFCAEKTCGFPLVINETFTDIHCSNIYCPNKVANRLQCLLEDMGINISYKKAKSLVIKYKLKSIMNIYKEDSNYSNLFEAPLTLVDYLHLLHLPYIDISIEKICSNYTDLELFYEDLDKSGFEFLESLLFKDRDFEEEELVNMQALQVYKILKTYRNEILENIDLVRI